MGEIGKGQITKSAAEVYEAFYVPALFEQWATRVADAVGIRTGERALDVACGTGVLAREFAARVGPTGSVTGVDINEGMLAVARGRGPQIEWRQAPAESLPFAGAEFDAAGCQFGLMFFQDKPMALREMARVLKPGGRLAVAVWDEIETWPGMRALYALMGRMFGEDLAAALRTPFLLGKADDVVLLFEEAGVSPTNIETSAGVARFPSLEEAIYTDVRGWVADDVIDDAALDRLVAEARSELASFVNADGSMTSECSAHIVTATKAA